jgi:hypothetical protein
MRTDKIDPELFDRLASLVGRDQISIYMPTHQRGREVSQDRIRLKNELTRASEQLSDRGWKPRERSERLAGAEMLLDDRDFWEHQSEGLGMFIDDSGEVTAVSLSRAVGPVCMVMPVYSLRTLAGELHRPVLQVLALTRGFVGLYRADLGEAISLDSDLPESFEDVNWFVDREKQRQQHPDRAGTSRGRHGHEAGARVEEDTRRFLREVSDALPAGADPLVVLGDDDLVSRFEKETDRATVSPPNSGLSVPVANPRIHELVRPVVEDLERDAEETALAEAKEQIGLGNTALEIETALKEAISGRIERVVFDRGADPIWGRVDDATLEVIVSEERSISDVDLLDRLVVSTISNGGSIRAVDTPVDGRPFVGIRRY